MPFAALDGVRRGCRAVVATAAGTVRPSERWLGRVINAMGEPIDGLGPLPPGPAPYPFRECAAAGACPHAGGRAARSRRARAQYLPHRLPRPAHGHFLRLRRRQIGAAVDARAQRVGRYFGHRAGRRARPRGAGILAGRSRPSRPRALGGGGLDLRRAGADAPPGGLSDAGDRGVFPRPATRTCWC